MLPETTILLNSLTGLWHNMKSKARKNLISKALYFYSLFTQVFKKSNYRDIKGNLAASCGSNYHIIQWEDIKAVKHGVTNGQVSIDLRRIQKQINKIDNVPECTLILVNRK